MSTIRTAAVVIGILTVIPAVGRADTQSSPSQPKAAAAAHTTTTAKAATHATKGVIKSIDETKLVLTRSGGKGKDMTFVLNPETQREGQLAVGSPVEVRYRTSNKEQIATVVSVQHKGR